MLSGCGGCVVKREPEHRCRAEGIDKNIIVLLHTFIAKEDFYLERTITDYNHSDQLVRHDSTFPDSLDTYASVDRPGSTVRSPSVLENESLKDQTRCWAALLCRSFSGYFQPAQLPAVPGGL